MSFVEDDQVPIDIGNFIRLCRGELIGCDDDLVSGVERQKFACFARVLVALALDNGGTEGKTFRIALGSIACASLPARSEESAFCVRPIPAR